MCEQSCAALCVLALRKPENSQVIVEGGGALAALEAMKAHPKEAGVQVGARHPCPCPHPHYGPSLLGSYSFPTPIVLQLHSILHSILSLFLCASDLIFPNRPFVAIWGGGGNGREQMGLS